MTTEDFKRRLTAILSADVEGYSRLMGEDEDSTVRTLTSYRELMSSLIEKHRGRVVDSPGDNLLAEFRSVMDAVRCAVEIQEELRIRNAELPEDRKMQFRIGINLGDVIEEGDRIYGDGINVAARVEGLADGGGICISGTVYDSIKNKLSMNYEFLGEHSVKNIKDPVRVYRIRMEPEAEAAIIKEKKARFMTWQRVAIVVAVFILGAVAIWYFSFRQAPVVKDVEEASIVSEVEEAPKTIAVLPFKDISPEKDQEYFVDGLSEEILNSLCQIPDLGVAGKTSSFSFKGKDKTIQEIASILGVDHILEGSVRKAGNALRITAQLVRASDGLHLWSEIYDRELKDIFAIQEDIATAVADELKAALGIGKSIKQLGGTENVEAYELYLIAKGQMWDYSTDLAIVRRSLKALDEAIALDPKFAFAWAYKSYFHNLLSIFGPSNLVPSELDMALSSAQKAIELEPNLSEAYAVLGMYSTMRGDWIEAELAYRKALKLATEQLSGIKNTRAMLYKEVGFFERANMLFKELLQNDPLNKEIRIENLYCLGYLDNIQKAEEVYQRGKELFGGRWDTGDSTITWLRLGVGDSITSDKIVYSDLISDVIKEHLDSPKDGLAELRGFYTDYDSLSSWNLMEISLGAAYFGDAEFALEVMCKTININAAGLFWNWMPGMREVRQLPRFKEFVREIGLVDYWNEFGWPDLCRPVGDDDFECE